MTQNESGAVILSTVTLRFPSRDLEVPIKKVIEIHGIKCALHREHFVSGVTGGWVVSEISTGMAVGRGLKMGDAVADAMTKEKRYTLKDWNSAIKGASKRLKARKLEATA